MIQLKALLNRLSVRMEEIRRSAVVRWAPSCRKSSEKSENLKGMLSPIFGSIFSTAMVKHSSHLFQASRSETIPNLHSVLWLVMNLANA